MTNGSDPDHRIDIAMELVRSTEAAALKSARWKGLGDKERGDQAAVDGLRTLLNTIEFDGEVVIGEGDKDHAPMLYHGERVGTGNGPTYDIAVDPIDGTRLLANDQPGAVCVVAAVEQGGFYHWQDIAYMDRIAVGPETAGTIDITRPITENLAAVASTLDKPIDELTVMVLDRPRHEELIGQIRAAGSRIRLIQDGDVAAAIQLATQEAPFDMIAGTGGTPETVLAAAALKCFGGDIQARLWCRNDDESRIAAEREIDLTRVFGSDDLVQGNDVHIAVTGLTTGELLEGVRSTSRGAWTQSLALRSADGSYRIIETLHSPATLESLGVASAI